jgi:outer membrane immunogenic protein
VRFVRIGIIATAFAASIGGVSAADLMTLPVSSDKSIPVAGGDFDWSGFYAGVYGVTQSSVLAGVQYGLGLNIGVDARFQMVLAGGEIDFQGLTGAAGDTASIQALGKAGVAVTNDLVLYALAGAGADMGAAPATEALLGGGLQLAVTDSVSVDARYLHGFALSGANPKDQVTLGAKFHF